MNMLDNVQSQFCTRVNEDDIKAASADLVKPEAAEIKKVDDSITSQLGQMVGAAKDKAIELWKGFVEWLKATFLNRETGKVVLISALVGLILDIIIPAIVAVVTLNVFMS